MYTYRSDGKGKGKLWLWVPKQGNRKATINRSKMDSKGFQYEDISKETMKLLLKTRQIKCGLEL
jgi:hypothetical protein